MSVSLQLYIIGGIMILLPVIALIVLRKVHKFRVSSVVSACGSYFLATTILMSTFSMFMASVGLDQEFWTNHSMLSEIVNILLNVVFQNITIFLVMKYILKKNIRIYDGIAMGISYWLLNALSLSTSTVSYARIASMSAEGRLSEMVTENLSLEALEEYVAILKEMGVSAFYIQLLGIIVLSVMTAVLCVFLFHAVKRGNKKILWLTMGAHLVLLALLNLSLTLGGNLPYAVACVVVIAVSVIAFVKYWNWYKGQQADLLRKKQEYLQRQKAMNGNVVGIKSAEEATDTQA